VSEATAELEARRHLLVDFGGVISKPQPAGALQQLALLSGATQSDFIERYWEHRDAFDRGLSAAEYWERVVGRAVGAGEVEQLSRADVESWTHLNPATITVLAASRAAGDQLTLLSNAPHTQADVLTVDPTMQVLFDRMIFSARIGLSKPDLRIYSFALSQIPATAKPLFIDDRRENVIAARRAGIPGIVFHSAEQLDDELARQRRVAEPDYRSGNLPLYGFHFDSRRRQ
jgi:putative hydrolase of the HAD superfamily